MFASKIKVKIYQFFTRSDKFSAVLQRAGFAESSSLQGTDSLGEFNLEICSEGSEIRTDSLGEFNLEICSEGSW